MLVRLNIAILQVLMFGSSLLGLPRGSTAAECRGADSLWSVRASLHWAAGVRS